MQYIIIGTSRMTPSCHIEPLEKLSLAPIKRLLSRQQQSIKSRTVTADTIAIFITSGRILAQHQPNYIAASTDAKLRAEFNILLA